MNYCVGFIFDNCLNKVLLVKKNRGPANMAGKLNGIGGKMEEGESGLDAMIRECREETGLDIKNWNFYCKIITTNSDSIYFYYSITNDMYDYQQMEDETLGIYYLSLLDELQHKKPSYQTHIRMPNLDWLIPMALNHYNLLDGCRSFEIQER
jgi:8-oxo-dGTP diphosphatase